jgi:uncharacterized protein YbaA (DUF1428 family)
MLRTVKIDKIDHFKEVITIKIEEDEHYQYSFSSMNDRQGLNSILQSIISNPQLIEHGDKRPNSITITHENNKWKLVAVIESILP